LSLVIFLDSGPLSLLTQRRGVAAADACRTWLLGHSSAGARFIVPEIVDYELRRELIRSGKQPALLRLNAFNHATPGRFLSITTAAMQLAAQLWANIRNRGLPTTDPRDLDVDVILAAQALAAGLPVSDIIVATSNPAHLSRMVHAGSWDTI